MLQIKGTSSRSFYNIRQSLLFDNSYLSKLLGTVTTFTVSLWVKRAKLGTTQNMVDDFGFNSGDSINFNGKSSASVYRDPSAWMHIVLSGGSLYVNGVLDSTGWTGSINPTSIGSGLDGYLAEVHFIDGQALGPERFALTDDNGFYNPIRYTGTYGTNGFYLPFDSDSYGKDYSGNRNDFSPVGFTPDSSVPDTPTNNYSTWNPLNTHKETAQTMSFEDGNLIAKPNPSLNQYAGAYSTIPLPNYGKWYFEFVEPEYAGHCIFGVGSGYSGSAQGRATPVIFPNNGVGWRTNSDAALYVTTNGSNVITNIGTTQYIPSTTDVQGVGIDVDSNLVSFYQNGEVIPELRDIAYPESDASRHFFINTRGVVWSAANFGQRSWAYEPPSGYEALRTNVLPEPMVNPRENFAAVKYSGGDQDIYTGFKPDFTWVKRRTSDLNYHDLVDSVRGVGKVICSNKEIAEQNIPASITAFNEDGFSVGSGADVSGPSMISWSFKGGGDAVINNEGSIQAEVSANKDMGFSVVKYSGLNGSQTLGHGLGVAPSLIYFKNLTNNVTDWRVFIDVPGVSTGTGYLTLSTSAAYSSNTSVFQGRPASSTVVYLGGDTNISASGQRYVAYCFANTEMLRVGMYNGNSLDDGPFITMPFKPAYFLSKRINAVDEWFLYDIERLGYNPDSGRLFPNQEWREYVDPQLDMVSNGIKIRTSASGINGGDNYLYLAIAEQPFKHARGR